MLRRIFVSKGEEHGKAGENYIPRSFVTYVSRE
jgi:hypothetical protein